MASALTNCKTCNHQVSKTAKSCPSCGEKLRMGAFAKVIFWILATPLILMVLPPFISGFSEGAGLVSPEQKKARQDDEARFKLAWSRVSAVKSLMRDPESFALESVHVTHADIVCIEYRARNGFGGMNRESVIVDGVQPYQSTDDDGKFRRKWNELCAAQESWNLTDRVKISL